MSELKTKDLIRRTAFRLFLINGYSAITLKDVEKIAQVSRKRRMYHYASKLELFIDVISYFVLDKQGVANIIVNTDSSSLSDFINDYINNVQSKMKRLSDFLMPDDNVNVTCAYMQLLLQAHKYYPDFSIITSRIVQQKLLLWGKIVGQAQTNGEINTQFNCKLVAKQFEYIALGQSFDGAFQLGLNIQELREKLMFFYDLIKK